MVRFNKKDVEARKELLASTNLVNESKENENGEETRRVNENLINLKSQSFIACLIIISRLVNFPDTRTKIFDDEDEKSPILNRDKTEIKRNFSLLCEEDLFH